MFRVLKMAVAFIIFTMPALAVAGSHGPFGIDYKVNYDNDGIINRKAQLFVEDLTLALIVGGAIWEGGDSRLGRTYWQSIDASALATVSSTVLKNTFSRSRPTESSNPNLWFQGSGHRSFPSGEVTFLSAAVTPFVIEYRQDHPEVYALELLPIYDMIARVKVAGHWQSDVLAGFALGTASGYLASKRDTPWTLGVLPTGFTVGFKKRF